MSTGRARSECRRAIRPCSAALIAVSLSLAGSVARLPGLDAVASADAIGDAKAKAARIAHQREQLTQDAEQLNEQANAAEDELARVAGTLAATEGVLAAQREAADDLQVRAADLAVQSYMLGDTGAGMSALTGEDGATSLQLRQGYSPVVLGNTSDVLDEARAAQQDTERTAAKLAATKTRQETLITTVAARRKDVAATQTRLATLAKQVDGDLARLVAEEEARQAAAAEAAAAAKAKAKADEEARQRAAEAARKLAETQAAQAAQAAAKAKAQAAVAARSTTTGAAPASSGAGAGGASGGGSRTTAPPTTRPARTPATTAPAGGSGRATPPPTAPAPEPPDVSNYPAPSPAAAVAVAEALRQLGKPYVFGAAGPDTFDCSGLTMWAWAKAGVSMPHYTVSQYNAFPKVPLADLAPGDLVFFNVNLGHMGMYIGGGQYVQAPRTGDVVKVSTLAGRNVVGAVRPG